MESSSERNKVVAGNLWARLRASTWAPLAGKGVLALVGFVALAFVGSGAAADRLPAPVGSYLGPAPAASAPAIPDAGAAADAGAVADAGAAAVADAAADAGAAADAAASAAITADGKVILNLAAEEDLRKLPGVGPTRAKAILALRAKLGRFSRPEDLLRVKGIGRRSLAKLRPKLLLDAPKAP
jgi:competence protein ComEA